MVALVALTRAQLGSVHCKVGCACSDEFKPLCGNDRQTYQNECKLRCSQCEKPGLEALFSGRCEDVFAVPAPVITYTAPIPMLQLAPAPVFYPFVLRPTI
ncbi:hypothetical protein L798_04264 [Zootermopsis nevadensis]|uniref:Kazal-like domain-containing protein n=1 Tax=Zootermopsis nevadensis TaxID=136037 RepID=A0A067RL12_ZOONE|nr:hypothetical protein L798_04264 [Zootermopsis nevadensis]